MMYQEKKLCIDLTDQYRAINEEYKVELGRDEILVREVIETLVDQLTDLTDPRYVLETPLLGAYSVCARAIMDKIHMPCPRPVSITDIRYGHVDDNYGLLYVTIRRYV